MVSGYDYLVSFSNKAMHYGGYIIVQLKHPGHFYNVIVEQLNMLVNIFMASYLNNNTTSFLEQTFEENFEYWGLLASQ